MGKERAAWNVTLSKYYTYISIYTPENSCLKMVLYKNAQKSPKCIYTSGIIQNQYTNLLLLCHTCRTNLIAITPRIKLHPSKFYTLLKGNNSVKEKLILWSFHIWLQMLCHFQEKYLPAFLPTHSDSYWARHTALSLNKIKYPV